MTIAEILTQKCCVERDRCVEGITEVIDQVEEQHPNRDQDTVLFDETRQEIHADQRNTHQNDGKELELLVFAFGRDFSGIHDPVLDRVIDRIDDSSDQQDDRRDHRGPAGIDTGIVCQEDGQIGCDQRRCDSRHRVHSRITEIALEIIGILMFFLGFVFCHMYFILFFFIIMVALSYSRLLRLCHIFYKILI